MKNLIRITAGIGAVLLGIGIVMALVLGFGFRNEILAHRSDFGASVQDWFFGDGDSDGWLSAGGGYFSSLRKGPHYSESETYANYSYEVPADTAARITGLTFEFAVGEVAIESGASYSVKADRIFSDAIDSYVKDGVWYIKDKLRKEGSVHSSYSPRITVTIPEGSFDDVDIATDAGKMTIEQLVCGTCELQMAAGSVHVQSLTVTNNCRLKTGAGEMKIYSMDGKNLSLENGVGSVYISGSLTGNNDVDCGIGEVEIVLTDREKLDFSYDVDCGIGEVRIGNAHYSGTRKNTDYNRNPEDYFKVKCGIGRVTIRLAE